MRIACIVARYGTDIVRGVEHHCRLVAEQLAERHSVDVLTTCAGDSVTWRNKYPEGADRVRGVTVRRFATARTRDPREWARLTEWLLTHRHTGRETLDWLKQQGPWAPGLTDSLERHHHQYDVIIFFGCLHAPTLAGLKAAPHKSVLVPAAPLDGNPLLGLTVCHEAFGSAAAIAWSSDAERDALRGRYALRAVVEDVIGCGVPLPEGEAVAEGAEPPAPPPGGRELYPPHIDGPASAFRRRHRMYDPFVLHGERLDPGQGGEELLEYFRSYVKDGGTASLVLMGVKRFPLPEDAHVRFAGTLPDEERLHAFEAATVVVVPAPDDGLSLAALEAFSVGTPVLGSARSAALVEHCRRSQAGLFYADRGEFIEALKLLLKDDALRAAMGRNGKAYINHHHRWSLITSKYEKLFSRLAGGQPRERAEREAPREREPERDRGDRGRSRDQRWSRHRGGHRRDRDRDRGRDRSGRPKGR